MSTAADERWVEAFDREWCVSPNQYIHDDVRYRRRQRIEIDDTGAAGTVNTFSHSLGRVPVGIQIINAVSSAAVAWYRPSTDAAWTATQMSARFDQNNARVLLEVF